MYAIQIEWNGRWVTVETGHKTRDDAEWATAQWKQKNRCMGDPFRRVQLDVDGKPCLNSRGDPLYPVLETKTITVPRNPGPPLDTGVDPLYDRSSRIKEAELE